jgi:hypothetical protein
MERDKGMKGVKEGKEKERRMKIRKNGIPFNFSGLSH